MPLNNSVHIVYLYFTAKKTVITKNPFIEDGFFWSKQQTDLQVLV